MLFFVITCIYYDGPFSNALAFDQKLFVRKNNQIIDGVSHISKVNQIRMFIFYVAVYNLILEIYIRYI